MSVSIRRRVRCHVGYDVTTLYLHKESSVGCARFPVGPTMFDPAKQLVESVYLLFMRPVSREKHVFSKLSFPGLCEANLTHLSNDRSPLTLQKKFTLKNH